MAFEQEVLAEVTRARAAYSPTEPIHHHPAVKSQQNVLDLQDEIERLESMIAERRELYNDQVYRYNTRISTVPTLPLAWVLGWTPREFFAATPVESRRPEVAL